MADVTKRGGAREAKRERMIGVLDMVIADVETDTARREGLPLTGKNVAEAFGEIAAQLQAVAKVVRELV